MENTNIVMEEGLVIVPHVISVGGVEKYKDFDYKEADGFQFLVHVVGGRSIKLWYETEEGAKKAREAMLVAIEQYWISTKRA